MISPIDANHSVVFLANPGSAQAPALWVRNPFVQEDLLSTDRGWSIHGAFVSRRGTAEAMKPFHASRLGNPALRIPEAILIEGEDAGSLRLAVG